MMFMKDNRENIQNWKTTNQKETIFLKLKFILEAKQELNCRILSKTKLRSITILPLKYSLKTFVIDLINMLRTENLNLTKYRIKREPEIESRGKDLLSKTPDVSSYSD